ncbi:MAG: outer membrane protein transport protein [Syntrophales bacterium]|nr:outer membrane protein transport protein [Syntrophales bacterium]
MKRFKFGGVLGPIAILLLLPISNGHANITEPGAVGARGMGMASVVANPDDPIAAFYYNPAGLTRIEGENIAGGAEVVFVRMNYRNREGYNQRNHVTAPIPFFGYTTDRAKPVVLGIGIYSTLGVGFNFYKDPAHGIYDDIESSAGVMYLAPTIAYRINPRLAVGFELNIGYGAAEFNQPLRDPVTGTPLGMYLETEADGFGYGCTIGLLYELTPSLTAGLNWRSPMKTSLEGDAKLGGIDGSVDIDLYWPQMVSLGLAYKPNPRLTFSATAKWADWTYLDKSEFRFRGLPLPNQPLVKDSRDTMRYSAGVEYRYNDKIVLRTGYEYDEHSVDSKYLSPLLADVNFHMFFGGIGFESGNWKADLFFVYTAVIDRENTESLVGYPNGEVSGNVPVPGFEINYRF